MHADLQSGRHPYQPGYLAVALSLADNESGAQSLIEELDVEHAQAGRIGPTFAAIVRGDLNQAVDDLDAMAEARQLMHTQGAVHIEAIVEPRNQVKPVAPHCLNPYNSRPADAVVYATRGLVAACWD